MYSKGHFHTCISVQMVQDDLLMVCFMFRLTNEPGTVDMKPMD